MLIRIAVVKYSLVSTIVCSIDIVCFYRTSRALSLPVKHLTFIDVKWNLDKAIEDLAKAINASTVKYPLWIVEAGEPDLIGLA